MGKIHVHSKDAALWLRLKAAEGVGPVTFQRLLKRFGSVESVMGASAGSLAKVEKIGTATAEKIARTRNTYDPNPELELADKLGVYIVTFEDERYPSVLKAIYDPPPFVYVKGELQREHSAAIAIVGSRRCSLYGREQAARFSHCLASAGLTIVSGMARGIDTAAHQAALTAGGQTLAVQGCGLANVFPKENAKLFEMIAESGACISELPLQTEPLAENFPARNRIIAGLSLGVIVIEAPRRSGALITAKVAVDTNREVMAIPGKIDSPLSRGAHNLIKNGAKLIETIDDVMDALGYLGDNMKSFVVPAANKAKEKAESAKVSAVNLSLSEHEQAILSELTSEPKHVDEVVVGTKIPAGAVHSNLIKLSLKGLVKQVPGNHFIRRPSRKS